MCRRPNNCAVSVSTKRIGYLIPTVELALNGLAAIKPAERSSASAAAGRDTTPSKTRIPGGKYDVGSEDLDSSQYWPVRRSNRQKRQVAFISQQMPPEEVEAGTQDEEEFSSDSSRRRNRKRRCRNKDPGLTKKNHARHFVKHDYHDHSHDPRPLVFSLSPKGEHKASRGGVTIPFPLMVHKMLDKVKEDGKEDIVSWQPHGRAFAIHNNKKFVEEVMTKYFRQTKISSFQRQLNLYGFRRLTGTGPDKGSYYHELFLRGRPFLCADMHRCRVKGTGVRTASSPETEPRFYEMSPLNDSGDCDEPPPEEPKKAPAEDIVPPTVSCSSSWLPSTCCCHSSFACGQRLCSSKCRSTNEPWNSPKSLPTPLPPCFDNLAVQQSYIPYPTSGGASYYLPTAATAPYMPPKSVSMMPGKEQQQQKVVLSSAPEPLPRRSVSFHSDVVKTAAAKEEPKDDDSSDDVSSIGSFLEEMDMEECADDTDYFSESGFGRLLENIVNHKPHNISARGSHSI